MKMLSFNNDPKIKADWVAKGKAHQAADMITAQTYGEVINGQFKACTIGCYADRNASDKHKNVANQIDGSIRLAYCRDAIFEGLSRIDPKLGIEFHTQWIEAVPVGVETAEFDRVADKLILKATKWKAEKYSEPENRHLLIAIKLYERRIAGGEPPLDEWKNAALDASLAVPWATWAAQVALSAQYALSAQDVLGALEELDEYYIYMRDYYLQLMAALDGEAMNPATKDEPLEVTKE